jgi:hypothetical protein
MNRFPWQPHHDLLRGKTGIYCCRSSAEVARHVMDLMRRLSDMPPNHPMLEALEYDVVELCWRGDMLWQLERWQTLRGACSCMDPTCGLLAEEAS